MLSRRSRTLVLSSDCPWAASNSVSTLQPSLRASYRASVSRRKTFTPVTPSFTFSRTQATTRTRRTILARHAGCFRYVSVQRNTRCGPEEDTHVAARQQGGGVFPPQGSSQTMSHQPVFNRSKMKPLVVRARLKERRKHDPGMIGKKRTKKRKDENVVKHWASTHGFQLI